MDTKKTKILHIIGTLGGSGTNHNNLALVKSGSGTLAYQWQRLAAGTWSDIAGATAASYTTPATLRSADNGAQFRVNVTNSVGSATSNVATLTVDPAPVVTNTCYSAGSETTAFHVATVFRWDEAKQSMVPPKDANGVSGAESEIEMAYMESWAKNVWADTLGLPQSYNFTAKG